MGELPLFRVFLYELDDRASPRQPQGRPAVRVYPPLDDYGAVATKSKASVTSSSTDATEGTWGIDRL